jgi:hypothetical protein
MAATPDPVNATVTGKGTDGLMTMYPVVLSTV